MFTDYESRKEGGSGLASIEDNVDALIRRLEDYIEKHEGGLITAIRSDTDNTMDNRMTITRKQKWERKQLYGVCKKLKCDHTNKWYMHNLAPVLENYTHKFLRDFDIHTDRLISARRPDLIIINKKKKRGFAKLWILLSRLTTE